MTADDVIRLLQTNPEQLLKTCYLHLIGGGAVKPPKNGQAQTSKFTVEMAELTIEALDGKAGEAAKIQKLSGDGGNLEAYYIPMVQTSHVGEGSSHYVLPSVGGPDVVLTSKLSGCLFGLGSHSEGGVLVSHIQPNQELYRGQGEQGMLLRQQDVSAHMWMGFSGHHMTSQVQFGYEYREGAAVIGIRVKTEWEFYLQESVATGIRRYRIQKVAKV